MAENAKWYVVQTYSGYENTVLTALQKHVDNRNLHELIHRIYIPMETVTEYTDNGEKTVERKVFPGYVFIKMICTDETWHIVRNIRGVTGFVGSGDKPLPLTSDEVAAWGIEDAAAEEEEVVIPYKLNDTVRPRIVIPYKVGESVRIVDGPMQSYTGVVEEIDADSGKVRVVVSMFGRETPVTVDLQQVGPVTD